ncbi:hypothetical protein D3C75_1238430 [compost metagenome]
MHKLITAGRTCMLRTAFILNDCTLRCNFTKTWFHIRPCTHVFVFFLNPYQLFQLAETCEYTLDLFCWEWIQLFNTDNVKP